MLVELALVLVDGVLAFLGLLLLEDQGAVADNSRQVAPVVGWAHILEVEGAHFPLARGILENIEVLKLEVAVNKAVVLNSLWQLAVAAAVALALGSLLLEVLVHLLLVQRDFTGCLVQLGQVTSDRLDTRFILDHGQGALLALHELCHKE